MTKSLILWGIIGILLLSLTSAVVENLPVQKQNDPVIVWQQCDNSSYSNVTSIKVGAITVSGQQVQTLIRTDYYEYIFTNTSLLGNYIVNGYCDEGGIRTSWAYSFPVTIDGQSQTSNTTFVIFLLAFSIVLLLISFIFKNHIFAFFSGLSFSLTGAYSMVYGFTLFTTEYPRMISLVILGLGLIITIISALEFITEMSPNTEGDLDSWGEEEE
jgi:hypothetical protein